MTHAESLDVGNTQLVPLDALADPPKPFCRGTWHAPRIGPTFRGLLPCRDLLQLNEVPAEVVLLPLLVTQALQKGCRGRTGGKESQCGRAKRGPT